mgnify:CR=1 FL=1
MMMMMMMMKKKKKNKKLMMMIKKQEEQEEQETKKSRRTNLHLGQQHVADDVLEARGEGNAACRGVAGRQQPLPAPALRHHPCMRQMFLFLLLCPLAEGLVAMDDE